MTKIKVEEINNINLDNGKWWQPKIDKKLLKNYLKEVTAKLGFTQFYIFQF